MLKTLCAVLCFISMAGVLRAAPLSPADRQQLQTLLANYTETPYRLAWSEYIPIPAELRDEFEHTGLMDSIADPVTGLPLNLMYERQFLTDGGEGRRLETLDITLLGPRQTLTKREIWSHRTRYTIPAGSAKRAVIVRFEDPTTPEQRHEAWSLGRSPYERFVAMGIFREELARGLARLLEADDAESELAAGGGRVFDSGFWRVSLELDPQGRPEQFTTGNASDPSKKPIMWARYHVMERFPEGEAAGQPLIIRKELLWPDVSDDWRVNTISVYQPIEYGVTPSRASFDWRVFAESALDAITGEVTDHAGNVIGTDAPQVFSIKDLAKQESPVKAAARAAKQYAKQNGQRRSGSLSTVFVVGGIACVLVGGGLILRNRFVA